MGYLCRWVFTGLRKPRRIFRVKDNNRFLDGLQFMKRQVVQGEFSLVVFHKSYKEENAVLLQVLLSVESMAGTVTALLQP